MGDIGTDAAQQGWMSVVPWPGMSKPRPRVTTTKSGKSHTYNPSEYTQWKRQVAEYLGYQQQVKKIEGPVSLMVTFTPNDMMVSLFPKPDIERFGRSDLDNLLGGVMDALQDADLIDNDNKVVMVHGMITKGGEL